MLTALSVLDGNMSASPTMVRSTDCFTCRYDIDCDSGCNSVPGSFTQSRPRLSPLPLLSLHLLQVRFEFGILLADSPQSARNSGNTLIEVRRDHRLADPEPLAVMLKACNEANRQ